MQRKKVILILLSRDQYGIKHLAKMPKGSVQGSARQSLAEQHLNHDQWFKEADIYWSEFLALMTGLHKTI